MSTYAHNLNRNWFLASESSYMNNLAAQQLTIFSPRLSFKLPPHTEFEF